MDRQIRSLDNPGALTLLIDPACPHAEDVRITDIAHRLALINRYQGGTRRPYSLAEHALLSVEIAERDLGVRRPEALMACLLRRAYAAYLGDDDAPLWLLLGPPLPMVRVRLQAAIQRAFALRTAAAAYATAVDAADDRASASAVRDLFDDGLARDPSAALPAEWISLRDRDALTWLDWRTAYLDKFAELQFGRDVMRQQQ